MKTTGIVVRTWNDAPISRRDSDGYADATGMCQANGKLWGNYSRLDQTAAYIQALADSTGLTPDQLIISTKGGPAHLQGTWIHPRLAVDLARWISPSFAVWMDGWFLEQLNPTPQPPSFDSWSPEQHESFYSQPLPLQCAQILVQAVNAGESNIARMIGRWFADGARTPRQSPTVRPRSKAHQPKPRRQPNFELFRTLDDLPPSMRDLMLEVQWRAAHKMSARTTELGRALAANYAMATIRDRVSQMQRNGLIEKHSRSWKLGPVGKEIMANS